MLKMFCTVSCIWRAGSKGARFSKPGWPWQRETFFLKTQRNGHFMQVIVIHNFMSLWGHDDLGDWGGAVVMPASHNYSFFSFPLRALPTLSFCLVESVSQLYHHIICIKKRINKVRWHEQNTRYFCSIKYFKVNKLNLYNNISKNLPFNYKKPPTRCDVWEMKTNMS